MNIDLSILTYAQAMQLLDNLHTYIKKMDSSLAEKECMPLGKVVNKCMHVDAECIASQLTEMEVIMMINTFDFLATKVKDRLLSETKYNEENFMVLKEKQCLIDDTIKKLS